MSKQSGVYFAPESNIADTVFDKGMMWSHLSTEVGAEGV